MRFIDFLLKHYESVPHSSSSQGLGTKNELVKFAKPQRVGTRLKISSICTHSAKTQKDSLFVALKGRETDGHEYLRQAVNKGASALLLSETDYVPSHFKGLVLKYKPPLKSLSKVLNCFYEEPSHKLFTVGVTGTNGKTSFCYLLEHLFKHCGWPTAVIGTVGQFFENHRWPGSLTTPEPAELFERLKDFVNLSARAVIMEVSSMALDQHRLDGLDFNGLVWTNLSQDHLDYHGSMDNYFQAKANFFLERGPAQGKNFFYLINQDDEYGKKLKKLLNKKCWTYGQDTNVDFCFKIKLLSSSHSVFELRSPEGVCEFYLPLTGKYNIYNAVSALSSAMLTGFKAEDCKSALKSFPGVPGRMEKVCFSVKTSFEVIVDYAHTPSALSSVLSALKSYFKNIILVFGCGGDRDKDKRTQMASIALKWTHHVFLTTDNPRHEDPEQIAWETLKGLDTKQRQKVTVELDRQQAIKKALSFAKKGDLVLIAGKGHEKFQIVGDKKIPFCDKSIALEGLKELY